MGQNEFDQQRMNEKQPDANEMKDDYEIGYGRPPKGKQFRKGVSGNPSGRPKKPRDFDQQLLREAGSFVTITENGRRLRISKHEVAIRQLMHKAMTGDMSALKTFVPLYRLAHERIAQLGAQKDKDLQRSNNARKLTDDDLIRIILEGEKDKEKE